jgi:ethanolamine-phosphate cytidylyltransferase
VVENYPYCTRLKDMDRFEVDFVAHGDDLSVGLDGRNSYQEIIDAGRFKVVKRTDGISTTDLVGRMLLCTKTHFNVGTPTKPTEEMQSGVSLGRYLTTSQKIVQFSNNKVPKADDTIVYVEGAFDLFHVGHVHILKQARQFGTYVIVGLTEDEAVNKVKGRNFPIMNINERVLGVLSCKYVDEVIMGVPYDVTDDVIDKLNINVVVAGKIREDDDFGGDPYAAPKARGIFREIDSPSTLSTQAVIDRLIKNRAEYEERQKKKAVKDKATMDNRPEEYKNVREL